MTWGALMVAMGLLLLAVWKWQMVTYILDIRVIEQGIEFRVFRLFVLHVLRFDNIEYVEELRDEGWLSHPTAYNCKTRFFSRAFFIQKKRGMFTRKLLVTPADPETFARVLANAGVRVVTRCE